MHPWFIFFTCLKKAIANNCLNLNTLNVSYHLIYSLVNFTNNLIVYSNCVYNSVNNQIYSNSDIQGHLFLIKTERADRLNGGEVKVMWL